MNSFTTLYFPHPVLQSTTVHSLLAFFEQIYYYQPFEDDGGEEYRVLAEAGLLKCYAPAPLGEDLPRFKQLIKDLKGHEEEFYSGYMMSLHGKQSIRVDEDSVQALISSITHKNGMEDVSRPRQEALWKARLVLKLAEILVHEERDIEKSLAGISGQEHELLQFLKGEDESEPDDPFLATQLRYYQSTTPSADRHDQLMKAWARLFMEDQETPHWILSTDASYAVAAMIDAYETNSKKTPTLLVRLPLPKFDNGHHRGGQGWGEEDDRRFVTLRQEVREKMQASLEKIKQLLWDAAHGDTIEKALPTLQHSLDEEKDVLQHLLKGYEVQGTALTFYLLPGMDLFTLFRKIGRLEEIETSNRPYPPNSIVAVLE